MGVLLPRVAWLSVWGACRVSKPFVGLGIIFSHFDVNPLLLPLMLITRAKRARRPGETVGVGGRAGWLAWQTVSFNDHFLGNFRDDGLAC